MKERTIIHWNDMKLRQHNGCYSLKIFFYGKILTYVSIGHHSHGFARHSRIYLIALGLKCIPRKSSFQGLLSPATPLSLQESGHSTLKRERAKGMGNKWESLRVFLVWDAKLTCTVAWALRLPDRSVLTPTVKDDWCHMLPQPLLRLSGSVLTDRGR